MFKTKRRVRFGYAHAANNRYDKWQMYAIGGSAGSTIFSEGNYFIAPDIPYAKEVWMFILIGEVITLSRFIVFVQCTSQLQTVRLISRFM